MREALRVVAQRTRAACERQVSKSRPLANINLDFIIDEVLLEIGAVVGSTPPSQIMRIKIEAMVNDFGELRRSEDDEDPTVWGVYLRRAGEPPLAEWSSDHADAHAASGASKALAREHRVKRGAAPATIKHLVTSMRASKASARVWVGPQGKTYELNRR